MRARSLKPGFFKNEILGSADPLLGTLFEGLWCMADRAGRLEDRPLRICAEVFPYRRKLTEKKVDEMLWWLAEHDFIVRYQIGAELFIQVVEFVKHQSPHKNEKDSTIQELTPNSHRARTVKTSTRVEPQTERLALTPDSLTPDSGLLTPITPSTGQDPAPIPTRQPESDAPARAELTFEQAQQLKATYPQGIYREGEWLVAQRDVEWHMANGHDFEELLAGSERYAAQRRATDSIGTQYVLSPVKFFDRREPKFADPFPVPRTKAEVRQDSNVDAVATWLAKREAS